MHLPGQKCPSLFLRQVRDLSRAVSFEVGCFETEANIGLVKNLAKRSWHGECFQAANQLNREREALNSESPLEPQVLDYLKHHPNAQDTLRGIVEWWLLKQRIAQTTADIEAALSRLLARGELSMRKGLDGQIHYRPRRKGAPEKGNWGASSGKN